MSIEFYSPRQKSLHLTLLHPRLSSVAVFHHSTKSSQCASVQLIVTRATIEPTMATLHTSCLALLYSTFPGEVVYVGFPWSPPPPRSMCFMSLMYFSEEATLAFPYAVLKDLSL
jgi:hypothetical protein